MDGTIFAITVGNGNIASTTKSVTGSIWGNDGSRKRGSNKRRDEDRASVGRDTEIPMMSGEMRTTVGNAESGRVDHGAAVPDEREIISGGDHGATIKVSTGGSKPGRVSFMEVVIRKRLITRSKCVHVDKGLVVAMRRVRSRGGRVGREGLGGKTGESIRIR